LAEESVFMMNEDIAFTWMLIGCVTILLSVPSTLAQRMAIGWLITLGGFLLAILCGIKKHIEKKKQSNARK